MKTQNSWERVWTQPNKFQYNGGGELNEETQNYETYFRPYDPAIGRFTGVDPLASSFASINPYNFAFNDPIALNDPNGDAPRGYHQSYTDPYEQDRRFAQVDYGQRAGGLANPGMMGSWGAHNSLTDWSGESAWSTLAQIRRGMSGNANGDWVTNLGGVSIDYGSLQNGILRITGFGTSQMRAEHTDVWGGIGDENGNGFLVAGFSDGLQNYEFGNKTGNKMALGMGLIRGLGTIKANALSLNIPNGLEADIDRTVEPTNEALSDYMSNKFGHTLRSLSFQHSFHVDHNSERTQIDPETFKGNAGKTVFIGFAPQSTNVYINPAIFKNRLLLYFVVGHELEHVKHIDSGKMLSWYRRFGRDGSKVITEFEAYQWQINMEGLYDINTGASQGFWSNYLKLPNGY